MRTPVFVAITMLVAIFGIAADAAGQGPSGMVTFSGSGAELLPSPTFEPATYEGTPGKWTFRDKSGMVELALIEDETDPSKATFLAVAEDGGEVWNADSIFGPILNVEIVSDTITFSNVSVPQIGSTMPQGLVLNGWLTRGAQVDVESSGVSSIKSQYSDPQR